LSGLVKIRLSDAADELDRIGCGNEAGLPQRVFGSVDQLLLLARVFGGVV